MNPTRSEKFWEDMLIVLGPKKSHAILQKSRFLSTSRMGPIDFIETIIKELDSESKALVISSIIKHLIDIKHELRTDREEL